jgi:hypothetical protein
MKPAAYISKNGVLFKELPPGEMDLIPLFATPSELNNEEIDNLILDVAEKPTDEDLYDFAKAILRKAQEK